MKAIGSFVMLAVVTALVCLFIYEYNACHGDCERGNRRCQDMCFKAEYCPR